MRQLSWNDTRYLYSDKSHSNSNVTLIQIYDQSTAPGGMVRFKSILSHIESRLDTSPIFRSRLMRVPFDLDNPYWVEDENFDIEHHVRHIALPKPGDWRQFCIQASRIHARAFDLNRPLWEVYVVEGLDAFDDLPPGSFAMLIKIHHATLDEDNINEINLLMHSLSPTPHVPQPLKPWFPETPPSKISLVMRGAAKSLFAPFHLGHPLTRNLVKIVPPVLHFIRDIAQPQQFMTMTRFSSIVSPYRVFDTRRFKLEEFKAIAALVPGATVNDAILAVCAGGLRRYLELHNELPATSLTAVAPVLVKSSIKRFGDRPRVSWMRGVLGTDIVDPLSRLRMIQELNSHSTVLNGAVKAKQMTDISRHEPGATLALASKILSNAATHLSNRMPLANLIIANVPGSAQPLYLNGARMTYFSAIMPLHDGMGLVLTVTSYDGLVIISPTSCRYLMPDPQVFTQCLRDSFQEFLALTPKKTVRRAKPKASTPKSVSKRRTKAPVKAGRSGASTRGKPSPQRRSA